MPFDACTLPTAEQPLRIAEFSSLLRSAVVESATETHTRLRLAGSLESTVRDLTARETQCCSCFAFTITPAGESLTLDIEVPPRHADILAALTAMATA